MALPPVAGRTAFVMCPQVVFQVRLLPEVFAAVVIRAGKGFFTRMHTVMGDQVDVLREAFVAAWIATGKRPVSTVGPQVGFKRVFYPENPATAFMVAQEKEGPAVATQMADQLCVVRKQSGTAGFRADKVFSAGMGAQVRGQVNALCKALAAILVVAGKRLVSRMQATVDPHVCRQ